MCYFCNEYFDFPDKMVLIMKLFVVVVDDEYISLISLKKLLMSYYKEDVSFEFCDSGIEALEVIDDIFNSGNEIAAIITDYIMPEMKGDELLIKVNSKYPDIKNIMLTGMTNLDGVINTVNSASLFQFIYKPFRTENLILTLNNAIKSYKSNKELKKKQKEIEEINRRLSVLDVSKNQFLFLMAHELRTPISSIKMSMDYLKNKEIHDNETLNEFYTFVESSLNRLTRISDLALTITRLRANRYEYKLTDITFSEFLDVTLNNYILDSKIPNNRLKIKIDRTATNFKIDYGLMVLVFKSILDNAFKYSSNNSTVFVEYTENDSYGLLSITDQGKGFPKEIIESPFELFQTDDISHHTAGIGLSLAVVKAILDLHGFGFKLINSDSGGASVALYLKKQNENMDEVA